MKYLVKLISLFTGILIICSCSKSDQFIADDMQDGEFLKKGQKKEVKVTVPFDAKFTGEYLYTGPHPDHPECGKWDPANGELWGLVINAGEGTGRHLGQFSHHFEFCCNFATGIYPGPGEYMFGYFEAANGDILYIMVAGQVMNGRLDDHPEDVVSWFRDPWQIIGGTGKFEGATGGGYTDDYNSSLDPFSHHHWKGSITIIKGKSHPKH